MQSTTDKTALNIVHSPCTVLVVDDEPSNVQMLVDILQADYRVLIATSGEQALKLIENNDSIDVVLLDVYMPGLTGFDVLKQVRSIPKHTNLPIIMVTAHSQSKEESYALEQGATDFLSKPVSAARVKARIKHQLNLSQSNQTIQIKNAALEEALRELQETKDELTDFMAMVSHELRTPIAILQCETELLVDGVRIPSEDNLKSLLDETKHVSELINDMFELVLSETSALNYNMQDIELDEILHHTAGLFDAKFTGANIKLNYECEAEVTSGVKGDQKRLRQVIDNLLENSLKYTTPGGKTILSLSTHAQRVIVTLEDTGPGIPKRDLDKIFDKFYRVDKSRNRARGGSGLGLAICKSIIQAHEGDISASESELGGLKIQFSIPALS